MDEFIDFLRCVALIFIAASAGSLCVLALDTLLRRKKHKSRGDGHE